MKRKLLDEITVPEMLQMRESGMSNAEIAAALDVSYATVIKYIGKQPPGMRVYRRITVETPKPTETPAACLVLQNKVIEMHGLAAMYEINCKEQRVDVMYGESVLRLPFDKLGNFADELKAIHRKLNELDVQHEMW